MFHENIPLLCSRNAFQSRRKCFWNTPQAPSDYTLVEFLDYQCPPCRASQKPLRELLTLKASKVRLLVRNLPLPMHPNAFSAAVAAEAAREQDAFEPIHDALLESQTLDEESITAIARKHKLNLSVFEKSRKGEAKQHVLSDMKMADRLHIDSTPSFVLCCPNGDVFRLRSFRQIKEMVQ